MHPIVIVGAGLAGYALARELRRRAPHVQITILAADAADFYSKPMLSNALAQAKAPADLIATPRADMARMLDATIVAHTRVERIEAQSHTLLTSSGLYHYHSLVLALGADPVRLHFWGDAGDAVLSVNDLDSYAQFRARLTPRARVALLGAGLIGCEFANDLVATGHAVTVLDPAPRPLAALLPHAASAALESALAEAGVEWRLAHAVRAADVRPDGYRLTTDDGRTVDADLVMSAVGLRPCTALAGAAGLATGRGIAVDTYLRSSQPDVYALGDCAEIDGHVQPYVMPIMHAARALAATLAGEPTPVVFPPMPVLVKTPACPVAVCPPPAGTPGAWEQEGAGRELVLRYRRPDGTLAGFALTGAGPCARRLALVRELAGSNGPAP